MRLQLEEELERLRKAEAEALPSPTAPLLLESGTAGTQGKGSPTDLRIEDAGITPCDQMKLLRHRTKRRPPSRTPSPADRTKLPIPRAIGGH